MQQKLIGSKSFNIHSNISYCRYKCAVGRSLVSRIVVNVSFFRVTPLPDYTKPKRIVKETHTEIEDSCLYSFSIQLIPVLDFVIGTTRFQHRRSSDLLLIVSPMRIHLVLLLEQAGAYRGQDTRRCRYRHPSRRVRGRPYSTGAATLQAHPDTYRAQRGNAHT